MQWIFTSNNKLIQERFSVQKSLSMACWIMFPNKRKKGTSHWSPDFSSTEELCALNSGQTRSQSSLYPSIRTARRDETGRRGDEMGTRLSLGFRIPDSKCWLLDYVSRPSIPESNRYWDMGFQIPSAVFRIPQAKMSRIPVPGFPLWVLRFSGFDYWLRLSVTKLP